MPPDRSVPSRCAYLTYPKVFTDDQKRHAEYVRVLPKPAFFDGMGRHTEIGIELEPGKTLPWNWAPA